jgi:ribosome modulation factor
MTDAASHMNEAMVYGLRIAEWCRQKGRLAACGGEGQETCPYPLKAAIEPAAWLRGWREAAR